MDEPYAAIIAGFPLFHGFTVQGAQRLLERGEVKEYVAKRWRKHRMALWLTVE